MSNEYDLHIRDITYDIVISCWKFRDIQTYQLVSGPIPVSHQILFGLPKSPWNLIESEYVYWNLYNVYFHHKGSAYLDFDQLSRSSEFTLQDSIIIPENSENLPEIFRKVRKMIKKYDKSFVNFRRNPDLQLKFL